MAYLHSEYGGGGHVAPSNRAAGAQSALVMTAEVGRFFQDLRKALRLTHVEAARHLATRPDIVAALESGDVRSLPPWPETCRIVRTFTGLAGLDPRPILFSLEQLRGASGKGARPAQRRLERPQLPDFSGFKQSVSDVIRRSGHAWSAVAARRNAGAAAPLPARKGTHQRHMARRVAFSLSLPVALILLVTQTSVLEAAVSRMPSPVARFVRGAQEYIAVKMAPVRNGMRWIEVDDPRSRRGDKLQTAAQSD